MNDFTKFPTVVHDRAQLPAAEQERETKAGMMLAALAVAALLLPFQGFLLMLILGAVHGLAAGVPAVGFGTALLIMVGVDLAAYNVTKFRRK